MKPDDATNDDDDDDDVASKQAQTLEGSNFIAPISGSINKRGPLGVQVNRIERNFNPKVFACVHPTTLSKILRRTLISAIMRTTLVVLLIRQFVSLCLLAS